MLQDIAAVRDAMLDAAGQAWTGARAATVDVLQYQYGGEVKRCCRVVRVHARGFSVRANESVVAAPTPLRLLPRVRACAGRSSGHGRGRHGRRHRQHGCRDEVRAADAGRAHERKGDEQQDGGAGLGGGRRKGARVHAARMRECMVVHARCRAMHEVVHGGA